MNRTTRLKETPSLANKLALCIVILMPGTLVNAETAEQLERQITTVVIDDDWKDKGTREREKALYDALVKLRELYPEESRRLAQRIQELADPINRGCIIAGVLGGEEGAAFLKSQWQRSSPCPTTVVRCLHEAARQDALESLRKKLRTAGGKQAGVIRHRIAEVQKRCRVFSPYRGPEWCGFWEISHEGDQQLTRSPDEYFSTPASRALISLDLRGVDYLTGTEWVLDLFGSRDATYLSKLKQLILDEIRSANAVAAHALWCMKTPEAEPAMCYFALTCKAGGREWATEKLGDSGCLSVAHTLLRLIAIPSSNGGRWETPQTVAFLANLSLEKLFGVEAHLEGESSNKERATVMERWRRLLHDRRIPEIDPNWSKTSPFVRGLSKIYQSQSLNSLVRQLRLAPTDNKDPYKQ